MIYEFVLQELVPITTPRYHNNPQPALLRVNKQIRSESSELYYKLNEFQAEVQGDTSGLMRFIDRARPGNLSRLRHLTVDFDFGPMLREKMERFGRAHTRVGPNDSEPTIDEMCEATETFISNIKALADAGLQAPALTIASPYFFDSRLGLPGSSWERMMRIVAEMRIEIEAIFEGDTSAMFVCRE